MDIKIPQGGVTERKQRERVMKKKTADVGKQKQHWAGFHFYDMLQIQAMIDCMCELALVFMCAERFWGC